MRIKNHLLALAHVGPGEHHAAVAKPDMGDLHGDGHAVDQHDLMAPVELISLARCIIERHIGIRRCRSPGLRPSLGIASNGIVAALISKGANLLVNPDQCQPFPRGLALIGLKKPIDMLNPRADLRQRLVFALIDEVRLARPQYLAHGVARHMQLPCDLLHRPAMRMKGPANARDRIHSLQLPLHPLPKSGWSDKI